MASSPVIAVVIPCFKERKNILKVIAAIGKEVSRIYVVDDCCPDQTGEYVKKECKDKRVTVVFNDANTGVGGAVLSGYKAAIEDKADVIVKIDGDGQMDPSLIHAFVRPILEGQADYTKGNRFFNIEDVKGMPCVRIVGNAGLSFFTKMSSGYWHMFDPTNGYTAISAKVAALLPMEKISNDFFFESDMLFRLNTLGAVVRDIPMKAVYADETSSLKVSNSLFSFFGKNMRNSFKRIFYNYFLRNFSIASVELMVGLGATLFGVIFGTCAWLESIETGITASSGTVAVAGLPVLVGVQLLLSFLSHDMNNVPSKTLHKNL